MLVFRLLIITYLLKNHAIASKAPQAGQSFAFLAYMGKKEQPQKKNNLHRVRGTSEEDKKVNGRRGIVFCKTSAMEMISIAHD
jgi:hypothetical protein